MSWKVSVVVAAGCALFSQRAYSQEGSLSREAMLLGYIHQANQNEVAMSKLAQENSESSRVKDFAAKMINEHTQADNQIVAFAASHKIKLPSLAEMVAAREARWQDRTELANREKSVGSETGEWAFYDVEQRSVDFGFNFQSTMDKLRNLKGPAFDRPFAQAMVRNHQRVFDRLLVVSGRISDPDEAKLVDQLLPVVNQHLTMAQRLDDNLSS
jgi:predicted outer membrane protein